MKNRLKIFFIAVMLVFLIGADQAKARKGSLGLIRDTEIEGILHEWGYDIFRAAEIDPNNVNIILVQSEAINAFVAGGANMFFYTGLLHKTETPGELIGVLAHEVGHIAGGHLIKVREVLERASYESIISTIIGIGAAIATGDPGAASAISMGGGSVAKRRFLAHSRIQESSADQAALTFLEGAKINPNGLASFMDKLKSEMLVPEDQQSEYIRTHPLVDNRIEAMQHRIAMSPYKSAPYPKKLVEQHARMKAKLTGFMYPSQVSWSYDDRDKSISAQYARAIAAYRNNQIDDALKRMDGLLGREADNPYFLELKGQMLVEFARVDEAIPYYKRAVEILPDAALIRIALAHALIESALADGDNENVELLSSAVDHLNRAVQKEQRSGRVHRLLATAYGRLGNDSMAKIHLAEEAVLQRNYTYARQHAEAVASTQEEGSRVWIKAKDIISFVKTVEKG